MSQVNLDKAIDLMTSRHTSQIKDRHAAMIRRICSDKSSYSQGFPYKELDKVIQIVNLLLEDIHSGYEDLIEPLCRLITHCKKDFKKEKMSDEYVYTPKLAQFLQCLTPIFKQNLANDKDLIISICGFVSELARKDLELFKTDEQEKKTSFRHDPYEENPMNLLKKKGTKYLKAIASTTIPEGLVHTLADNVNNYEIAAQTVQTISALSVYEPLSIKIGELGALKDLIVVVCNIPNFRDPLVNICIECIWNILEQSGEESIRSLAREELLLSLRWTLQKVIREGYKLTDRKLRNELMILIASVVACVETHNFLLNTDESAECFLQELIRYGSYDEINLAGTSNSKAMWGTETEDLEFKKLVWTSICRSVSSGLTEAISLVESSDFMPALLLYLDPSQNNSAISRWEDPQKKELQIHALNCIFHILPLFQDHFQQQNGNYCLVHFLSTYSDIDRKVVTLKALEIASQCNDFKLELADEGLFDTLLDIVQSESDYPLIARELALSIVSNACKDCRDNQKEIRRKGWIEVIKSNLKSLPPSVTGEPDQFLLSLLDCLWNGVLSNKRSLLHFIDIEGISTVLNFLDECLEVHRRIAISCLCKLLKAQRGKNSFIQWNSRKDMANASGLLIRIYEEEENRLGITYTEDRVLKDPQRPLAYTEPKSTKGFERLKEALEEAEKQSEMTLLRKKQLEFVRKRDLRASIYCCLSEVGFDCNELVPTERQKMEVIRMYPEFRKGELFLDIKNELESLGIKPTSDDRYWLQQCLDEVLEQASNTIKNQSMIAREHKREEEKALSEFYTTIMKSGIRS